MTAQVLKIICREAKKTRIKVRRFQQIEKLDIKERNNACRIQLREIPKTAHIHKLEIVSLRKIKLMAFRNYRIYVKKKKNAIS